MKKKGQTGHVLLEILIVVSLLVVLAPLLWNKINTGVRSVDSTHLTDPTRLEACKKDHVGQNRPDADGDGLPNFCDNCPLTKYDPVISDLREGGFKTCEKSKLDEDGDCYPKGCCGNDADNKWALPENIKKHKPDQNQYWCGNKVEDETINPKTASPRSNPPYAQT